MRKSLLAVLVLAACSFLAAQQAMNNDAVIKLIKAGLSDDRLFQLRGGQRKRREIRVHATLPESLQSGRCRLHHVGSDEHKRHTHGNGANTR